MAQHISIDPEAAKAVAARHRAQADELEQAAAPTMSPEELQRAFGPVYSPYVQAVVRMGQARQQAYERLAQDHRDHAAKLDDTVATMLQQDASNANRVAQAAESGLS